DTDVLVSFNKLEQEFKSYQVFDYQYWEPGYTQYDKLYLRNEGNLHFKYELRITPTGRLTDLAKVIDVYSVHAATIPDISDRTYLDDTSVMTYAGTLAEIINERDGVIHHGTSTELGMGATPPTIGTFYEIGIAFKMQEDAGNEYQDMMLCEGHRGFNIGLYATQWTAESDSFNYYYDENATFDFTGVSDTDGLEDNTDADEKLVEIYTAEQLLAFADNVNSGANTYSGYTVKLMNDITLGGYYWEPIGNDDIPAFGSAFSGTFDGNNKTISNVNINTASNAGLFGVVNGDIMNLNVEMIQIKTTHRAGGIAAYIYGDITNCSVKSGTIYCTDGSGSADPDGDKVGGIAGWIGAEGADSTVSGNTVSNLRIFADRDAGQVVGCMYETGTSVENNTVNDVKVAHTGTGSGENIGLYLDGQVGRVIK
ncbi:MAG: hypothetical protein IJ391_04715, partial [Clostridia bacterium]|nr:hypothetical protein [Clostridia bacterium]